MQMTNARQENVIGYPMGKAASWKASNWILSNGWAYIRLDWVGETEEKRGIKEKRRKGKEWTGRGLARHQVPGQDRWSATSCKTAKWADYIELTLSSARLLCGNRNVTEKLLHSLDGVIIARLRLCFQMVFAMSRHFVDASQAIL